MKIRDGIKLAIGFTIGKFIVKEATDILGGIVFVESQAIRDRVKETNPKLYDVAMKRYGNMINKEENTND